MSHPSFYSCIILPLGLKRSVPAAPTSGDTESGSDRPEVSLCVGITLAAAADSL